MRFRPARGRSRPCATSMRNCHPCTWSRQVPCSISHSRGFRARRSRLLSGDAPLTFREYLQAIPVASFASDLAGHAVLRAGRALSWPSRARAAASVRLATAAEWLETAAHLVDRVIPPVPVWQWVISVPKRLRCFLADRQSAVAALTRIFVSNVERLICTAAGSTRDGDRPSAARSRLGAVSFLYRFDSALNHHVYLGAKATDGVFVPTGDGPPALLRASCLPKTVAGPAYSPRPIWPRSGSHSFSIRKTCLTPSGQKTKGTDERDRHRLLTHTEPVPAAAAAAMLRWENSGFSVDASVRITLFRPKCVSIVSHSSICCDPVPGRSSRWSGSP